MLQELGRLLEQNMLTFDAANEIAEDMSLDLASQRNSGEISNDAFLEAGVIQGGISVLANMVATGVDHSEMLVHFKQIRDRADTICINFPELKVIFNLPGANLSIPLILNQDLISGRLSVPSPLALKLHQALAPTLPFTILEPSPKRWVPDV